MKAVLQLLLVLEFVVRWSIATASWKHTEALLEWIEDLGGGIEGVGLMPISGMGMGVFSISDLEVGTMVTRTPLSALINLEHALVTELFGSLSEEVPQLSNTNIKALFLAHERKKGERWSEKERAGGRGGERLDGVEDTEEEDEGKMGTEREEIRSDKDESRVDEGIGEDNGGEGRSFWQPYLDMLPTVLHTTLFFSEEELDYLQTSMVKEFAITQQSAAKKAYDLISEAANSSFPELRDLSLADLKWGVSTWSSRAHSVRIRDTVGEWQIASCLVPLSDMINMAKKEEDVNVQCNTNDDSTHFECRTTTNIPSGKQLLAEYIIQTDKRNNGRLLLHYGFVLPGNPYDSVSIKFPEVTHDLPHYKERIIRQEFSKKLKFIQKSFHQLTHPGSINPTINVLLQVMRLIHGSIPELQRASQLSPPYSQPLGSNSEHRVLKKTMHYLRNILSSYPTTIEQDIQSVVSRKGLSYNSQLALILRSEEKRLLNANIGHVLSLLSQTSNTDHNHHHNHRKTEL